jgi:hypothetical protein
MASTRKQCRAALGVAFAGQGFTSVFPYAPLDLGGASKVLVITVRRSHHERMGPAYQDDFHVFFLDVYIKRGGGVNTEDALDEMHEVIRAVVKANVGNAAWNEIELEEESDALFAEVAGVPYRVERHPIKLKVSGD